MPLEIRAAASADVEAISAVYNHYVENSNATFELEPVSLDERLDWFSQYGDSGPCRLLVAEESGTLLGYATASAFHPKPIYSSSIELGIYVAPTSIRAGIGSALYSELLAILSEESSVERLVAGVKLPNEASIAFHLKFGFEEVGTFRRVGRRGGTFFDLCWLDRPVRLAV